MRRRREEEEEPPAKQKPHTKISGASQHLHRKGGTKESLIGVKPEVAVKGC